MRYAPINVVRPVIVAQQSSWKELGSGIIRQGPVTQGRSRRTLSSLMRESSPDQPGSRLKELVDQSRQNQEDVLTRGHCNRFGKSSRQMAVIAGTY